MYRNKKLTQSANHESCVSCGADDGTIVWAHSNQYLHGKGRGIKAHDIFGAYLCHKCHGWLDGNLKDIPNSELAIRLDLLPGGKNQWWEIMWQRSLIIACEKGYL